MMKHSSWLIGSIVLVLVALSWVFFVNWDSSSGPQALMPQFQGFVTIFLGIFISATPFLLIGSLVASFLRVYLVRVLLLRLIPKQPFFATLFGVCLGLVFPVCECGVVPVARRLQEKGMPLSTSVAFLLAAPVVNPVVIISTYAAFGWSPMLWARVALTIAIGLGIGLLFCFATSSEALLSKPPIHVHSEACCQYSCQPSEQRSKRVLNTLSYTGDEFLEMGRLLVIGCFLAAAMQTLIPQSLLLSIGKDPISSVMVLLILAFLLSVCSTVDAFLALTFIGTFTSGSILGFLVFGPMVDVKSTLLFSGVFRRRVVAYLMLLPLMLVMCVTLFLTLNVGW
jgi:uncharacterized membrane protein YraQ (UPF0718 family)